MEAADPTASKTELAPCPRLLERVEGALVRGLLALPGGVQRILCGGRATRIDGQTLAPDVQLLLALMRLEGRPGFETLPPEEARAEIRRSARMVAGAPPSLAEVRNLLIPGPGGAIPARHYRPRDVADGHPLVIYFHGGGWVVGDLESHDPVCRKLAADARVGVLAVDYRLAPEHPFPAAADDALAALHFAADHAPELGADARRVAVAGDSAGGNLAAVVSLRARREGGPEPALQVLIYPVTDLARKAASYGLFSDGFFLTEQQMDWYSGHYLPGPEDARDPDASPLLAPDAALGGLPPAIVATAGFDPLRDEGEAYAGRLRSAGVSTRLHRFPDLIHGFWNMPDVSRSARRAVDLLHAEIAEALAAS